LLIPVLRYRFITVIAYTSLSHAMPENIYMFIWYHANQADKMLFQQWLSFVRMELGIQGELFRRDQDGKTTFMEVFEAVDSGQQQKIEHMAMQQPCFQGIQRRCEAFTRTLLP